MHPLPCIDTMSEFNEHTVVLHLCRTALASTLLPVVCNEWQPSYYISRAPGERVWDEQGRLCGPRRNEANSGMKPRSEHVCLTERSVASPTSILFGRETGEPANKQSASEPTVSVLTYVNPKNYALERILRRTSRDGLGEWKVFCERFLLGNSEKISN